MALSYIYSALLAIIVQASCLSPSVDTTYYNNTATALNGAITLYWNVYANNTIEVALVAQGTGWVGFGIGAAMADADIILSNVVAGTVSVGDYFSTAEVPPQLDTSDGGVNNILDFNGQEVGGVTTIKFLRNLDTGDSKDKPITNGSISIICAYNPTNDDRTVYHGGTNRQAININFFGGGATVITDNKNSYRIAHGVLMAFGWGFFIWVGMFIARFFKSLGHKWFILHIVLNAVGLAAVIVGFILAIIMVDQDFKQPDKLTRAHSILGLIVVILGVLQPIIGTIADRLFDPNRSKTPVFPDMVHWWVGRISMLASIATIFMGFAVYDTGIAAFIIYAVWNLILLIGFIVLSIKKGTGHGDEVEMK